MIIYAGPLILGFLLGFLLGTRIKENPLSKLKFDASVYAIFLIVAVIVAYFIQPFPYYADAPLASGFVACAVGIIFGKLIFGRQRAPQEIEE
ncbi:MAG TPA: energy-converting hydrogenase B subunit J [Methanobacteriaceae archaeon]|nr:energy-converting hydrogenase B subunit J [Methanobacteriaceae archaeon]